MRWRTTLPSGQIGREDRIMAVTAVHTAASFQIADGKGRVRILEGTRTIGEEQDAVTVITKDPATAEFAETDLPHRTYLTERADCVLG